MRARLLVVLALVTGSLAVAVLTVEAAPAQVRQPGSGLPAVYPTPA